MSDSAATLKEKLRRLPDKPGVYLMKDRLGRIIYVGKAKSLKKRVSSYFQRGRARTIAQPKIRALIEMIEDIETYEVKSEPEALLLEVLSDYQVSIPEFGTVTGTQTPLVFLTSNNSRRNRQPEREHRSPLRRTCIGVGSHLHRSAMQLQNPVGHGQSDSAALWLRRKVQLEDTR